MPLTNRQCQPEKVSIPAVEVVDLVGSIPHALVLVFGLTWPAALALRLTLSAAGN